MKKSLVALATFSLVGTAFADVDVSGGIKLYGLIDQAAMKQSWVSSQSSPTTGNNTTQSGNYAASATSRLGIRGNRDLGDGLKGLIQVEIELVPQNNSDQDTGYKTRGLMPPKNRGTFVGLESKEAGSIRLGTQETTAYELVAMDVNGRVEYKPQTWRYVTSASTQDRAGHSIKLTSPEIAGITASAMYAPKQINNSNDSLAELTPTFTSLGVKYHNGNLRFAYVNDSMKNPSAVVAASYRMPGEQYEGLTTITGGTKTTYASGSIGTALKRNLIGASYDAGFANFAYIYADSSVSGTGTAGGKLSTNTIGVSVPFDKFKVALSMGNGSYSTTGGSIYGKVTDTTLGGYYSFDKSTSAYLLSSNATHTYTTNPAGSTKSTALGVKFQF